MSERAGSVGADGRMWSTERARQILDQRARLLAEPLSDEQPVGEVTDVLTFELAHERYAIETRYVREVLRPQEVALVPRTSSLLHGICAIRGELLPVFDLRPFFGIASKSESAPAKVIVIGGDRTEFGILADDVLDVVPLDVQMLSESADVELTVDRSYLRGVTKEALIVLDGRRLLEEQTLFLE